MGLYFEPEQASALKQEMPFGMLLEHFGIPVKKWGGRKSILCPLHSDKHYGSCFLRGNHAYCHVCAKSINGIALAQSQGYSYYGALELFAKLLGKEDEYEQKGQKKKNKPMKVRPKILGHELEAIGLLCYPTHSVAGYTYFPKEEKDFELERVENEEFLYEKLHIYGSPIRELEKEDPEAFDFLVCTKAKEKMYNALALAYDAKRGKFAFLGLNAEDVVKGSKNIYAQAEEILNRFGEKTPSRKDLEKEIMLRTAYSLVP